MSEGYWQFENEEDANAAAELVRSTLTGIGCRGLDIVKQVGIEAKPVQPGEKRSRFAAPPPEFVRYRPSPGRYYLCAGGNVVVLSVHHHVAEPGKVLSENLADFWTVRLQV